MSTLRFGYVTGPLLGALWMVVLSVTVAIAMSFATGEAFRPGVLWSLLWGALGGAAVVALGRTKTVLFGLLAVVATLTLIGFGPILVGSETSNIATAIGTFFSQQTNSIDNIVLAIPTK